MAEQVPSTHAEPSFRRISLTPETDTLFRLIHNGSRTVSPTPQFTDGDLLARNPQARLTNDVINNHLRWRWINGPLISFCTTRKAQRYLSYLRRGDVQNITLIAIHKLAFPRVISAYEWALKHDYNDPKYYNGNFWWKAGDMRAIATSCLRLCRWLQREIQGCRSELSVQMISTCMGACMMSSS